MKYFLFLVIIIGSGPIFATGLLKVKILNKVSEWEQSRFSRFLNDVEARLPRKIKPYLNQDIDLKFVDYSIPGNHQSNFYLRSIECFFDSDPQGSESNSQKDYQMGGDITLIPFMKPQMKLNQLFWREILSGPEATTHYSCGLKSTYKLAMTTFIHELAHIYDREVEISQNRRFRHLLTFSREFIFFVTQKNKETKFHPDPYELTSPEEAFAVTLGYFLLDEEFKCRRPSLYNFYAEHFQFRPFANSACKTSRIVKVSTAETDVPVSLDLDRFYRADYFLASEGPEMASRFGHSMLKLIFCAPGAPLTEKCIDEPRYHIIVSFRANLVDKVDNRKAESGPSYFSKIEAFLKNSWYKLDYLLKGVGLNGSYPSTMFLMSPTLVLDEYNNHDFRDVISTPLNLSFEEKRDLLDRILEIKSGYQGSYNFLTNNCRTETEDLLKSVIRSKKIEELTDLTPVGMRKGLKSIGLGGSNNSEKIYYSLGRNLSLAVQKLKGYLKKMSWSPTSSSEIMKYLLKYDFDEYRDVRNFVKSFSSQDRYGFFLEIKDSFNGSNTELKEVLSLLLTVESGIFLFVNMDHFISNYLHKLRVFENLENFSSFLTENEKKEIELEVSRLSAALNITNHQSRNYGIALESESGKSSSALGAKPTMYPEIRDLINSVIKRANSKKVSELNRCASNIVYLSDLINSI